MVAPCPDCGCTAADAGAHAIRAALLVGDVDRAIEQGLLDTRGCAHCSPGCTASLLSARDARHDALAARERFRARAERLQRRVDARQSARAIPAIAAATPSMPALPAAAAAALARARAKAAGQGEA